MRHHVLSGLRRAVLPESLLLATICFADLAWTIVAVQGGIAKESNPLLEAALSQSVMLFAVVKLTSFLLPVSVFELMRPRWPNLVVKGLRTAVAGYVAIYLFGSLRIHGFL